MSDTTPAPPCKARCKAGCGTCTRYSRALLVITCATLLCALVSAVLGISTAIDVEDGSSPGPSPSTTAPADPSPSSTPNEPEPTNTPCNMFDPECSSGGTSGGTTPTPPDSTPIPPDSTDGSGGGNGSGALFGGATA
ncbi:hypothetical protein ACGFR8_31630 [Streptomyces brevispora]|uniref:hypothetical protein n=1 Tax=Streptomyces brevispora TaxID=887462 RepID=UPI00371F022B